MAVDEAHSEDRFKQLYGYQAGYLPSDFEGLLRFQRWLKWAAEEAAADEPDRPMADSVAALARLLFVDGVTRMYVDEMIREVPAKLRTVEDIPQLLTQLNHIVRLAPRWEEDPKKRVFFPMSALFGQMMITEAGEAAFRQGPFNDAIRGILKEWCAYLDSWNSRTVLNEGPNGWLCEAAYAYNKLDEFVIPDRAAPHWGWSSYNAFFHREIKASARPIAEPGNPKAVISANDGTVYRISRGVKAEDRFWLKGQPYSLVNMLAGSAYLDRFLGGDVFQSFLSGANYHRLHAPVTGIVREAYVVEGLMFGSYKTGTDPQGIESQGYQASVNTRGLIFIESDDPVIGLVCCIPIGITEISSIRLGVQRAQRVKKGEEIARFCYGGSSMALVFQPGAIARFEAEPASPGQDPTQVQVNGLIAVAN